METNQQPTRVLKLKVTNDKNPIGFQDTTKFYTKYKCQIVDAQGKPAKVPDFIQGDYYKQTGAAFNSGLDTALLDGLAGIASFHFNGQGDHVLFSNTLLEQKVAQDYVKSEGEVRSWVGTASSPYEESWVSRALNTIANLFRGTDKSLYTSFNPNVVVWRLSDDDHSFFPAASTEADGTVLRFEPETLKSIGPVSTMKGLNPRDMIITTPAHYFELGNGFGPFHVALEMQMEGYFPPTFTFNYVIFEGKQAPFKRVFSRQLTKFSYLDRAKQPVDVRAAYMHTYAQTEKYLVLMQSRMRLDYGKLIDGDFSKGFFGLFSPQDLPVSFLVYEIVKGASGETSLKHVGDFSDKKTICHFWHISNSFEEQDDIVIDCSAVKDISFQASSYMIRIKINPQTGMVDIKKHAEGHSRADLEFPQANPLVMFHPYHFSYALFEAGTNKSVLVKLDVQKSSVVATAYDSPGFLLAEPVFVPRLRKRGNLTKEEEEDGVVLLAVTDTRSDSPTVGKSWLAVLDPRNLNEIARIMSPEVINAGLHSHFFSADALLSKI